MALITCKHCGNRVSTSATVCPKCGCPVSESLNARTAGNNTPKNRKDLVIALISVLVLVLLGGVGYYFYKQHQQKEMIALYEQGTVYYEKETDIGYSLAFDCFRKAAEMGYGPAQYLLGFMYLDGRGVKKDEAEAERLLRSSVQPCRKAAEQGDAVAQYFLGDIYEYGYLVEQDLTEAVKWFRKSAEQGNVDALFKMAECYHSGNGVNKDKDEAYKWLKKAAEQGDERVEYIQEAWELQDLQDMARRK